MTASTKTKAIKTVKVISRIEFKSDSRKVVYTVRSSNGVDKYETTLFNGKATGCQCPATKPCYHMTQLEVIEAGRNAVEEAQNVFDAECKVVNQKFDNWSKANGYEPLPAIVDEEYEAWKKATGHDRNMSRVEYDMEFDPNGLNL